MPSTTKKHVLKYIELFQATCPVFVLHVAGFVMGYLWARLLRLGEKERRTVSIEVGMQNSGLGATLAQVHFAAQPGAAMVCAISALYHCLIGSVLASVWRSRPPGDAKIPPV